MTTLTKVTTIYTSNVIPGEIINMDFDLYKFNFHTWIHFQDPFFLWKD